jgi:hypothetical protein
MMTRQTNPVQTSLFVLGLALGLISSLTGCGGGSCGSGFDWPWESDTHKEAEPNLVDLPAVFSQSEGEQLRLDELEMEVVSEDLVVVTYFTTDADGEDRLVEIQFEVTDIYRYLR